MMLRGPVLVFIILLLSGCSAFFVPAQYEGDASNAYISRVSGVAPLSVHFRSGYTPSDSSIGDFHNMQYEWDFGDFGVGTWGTNDKDRNFASGPIAAHVFEEAGDYTVTLRVFIDHELASSEQYNITVEDPADYYDKTICVSDINDFTGAPQGAICEVVSDLSDIGEWAVPGTRILLRRGAQWNLTNNIPFPENNGPVEIGAFGIGENPDSQGLFDNAPEIIVNSEYFCDLNRKQNWTFNGLKLVDGTGGTAGSFTGVMDMQFLLFLNLDIEGFDVGLGWGHYNDSNPLVIDHLSVVNCNIHDSYKNCFYGGSERFVFLGNRVENSSQSHATRIWQAYRSVISNNIISGSSIDSDLGRLALKLHGPGEDKIGNSIPNSRNLEKRTREVVISDNVFGGSNPWPVVIGPQDIYNEERLSDIIFEKNLISNEYGITSISSQELSVSMHIWARYATIRNNIIDASGSSRSYKAISIGMGTNQFDFLPPAHINIYNNTIYKRDNSDNSSSRSGFDLHDYASNISLVNNLIAFPDYPGTVELYEGRCDDLFIDKNMINPYPGFIDPNNIDALERDYSLIDSSLAIDKGINIPVYDDFFSSSRRKNFSDIGAIEN